MPGFFVKRFIEEVQQEWDFRRHGRQYTVDPLNRRMDLNRIIFRESAVRATHLWPETYWTVVRKNIKNPCAYAMLRMYTLMRDRTREKNLIQEVWMCSARLGLTLSFCCSLLLAYSLGRQWERTSQYLQPDGWW